MKNRYIIGAVAVMSVLDTYPDILTQVVEISAAVRTREAYPVDELAVTFGQFNEICLAGGF